MPEQLSFYAEEIRPGEFHAIGAFIPADRDRSWFPNEPGRWLPVQAYLLVAAGNFVLLDTGIAPFREPLLAAVRERGGACPARRVLLTRREPDTTINLPAVVDAFGITTVSCVGELSPLDFFENLDEANTVAHIWASAGTAVDWLRPGSIVEIGPWRFEVLRAPVRVLSTGYYYEHTTRTLFASDGWGFLTVPEPSGSIVAREGDGIAAARIATYLSRKFDWTLGADTTSLCEEIRSLEDNYEIARLCCNTGCVIEGVELVRRTFSETKQALMSLGRRPRQSLLTEGVIEKLL